MRTLLAVLVTFAIFAPIVAEAGDCVTRKSGSVVITTCSSDNPRSFNTRCRSYRSGSVTKTTCS